MTRHELEVAQAKLLADLARNAPDDVPMRPGRKPPLYTPLTDEQLAAWEERRRARNSRVSRSLIRRLKAKTSECYLCHQRIGDDFEIDHIIPISKGGTHTEDNLALTHAACNNRKSALYVSIDITTRRPEYHR